MMREKDFTNIIQNALTEINYVGTADNNRLRAAIDDLAVDCPEEKKIFMRNADDQFLKICSNEQIREGKQKEKVKEKASKYIQDEYHMNSSFADSLAQVCVDAFAQYSGGEMCPGNVEPGSNRKDEPFPEDTKKQTPYDGQKKQITVDKGNQGSIKTSKPHGSMRFLVIGAGVLVVIAIAVLVFSNQNSSDDFSAYEDSESEVESYEDDGYEEDYNYYEIEGLEYAVPSSWEETTEHSEDRGEYFRYWTDEGVFFDIYLTWSTVEGKDIEVFWNEYPEGFNGEDQVYVDSGTRLIDGVTAYWVESDLFYDDGTKERFYELMIPLDDQGDKCAWISTRYDIENSNLVKSTEDGLECLLDQMRVKR